MADTIRCPQCQCEIEVTEVLSNQLRTDLRKEFEATARRKEAALADREKEVDRAQQEVQAAQNDLERRVAEQLAQERKRVMEEALEKARAELSVEVRDRDQRLIDLQQKLKVAEDVELVLRKERRELEAQTQALELTITRRLDEERARIREDAKKEADDARHLKDAEKDKLIGDLKKQIDDLKRKSEQGSQQLQGEVLEIALEDLIRQNFSHDDVEPVSKGVHGGDVVQTVRDFTGASCGTILWESKRTKNWNDGWLPKLRDDQRFAKAQIAILVSVELPKGTNTFCHIDGIWVTSTACAIGLATALRAGLIEIATAKRSLEGRNDKMEFLYGYLSGPEFRHHVEGIVESFVSLRDELEAEKRAMNRIWAKREKQLERAVLQTAGMYGDLSGIIGASLQAIDALDLPMLAAPQGDVLRDLDTAQ